MALTQAFSNSLWPHFAPFVVSVSKSTGDQIRAHPEMVRLQRFVHAQMQGLSVLKVKVYNLHGRTVFSTDMSQIGEDQGSNPGFLGARSGKVMTELTRKGKVYTFEGVVEDRDVITSYVPIRRKASLSGRQDALGPVEAVFELYYDATPLIQAIHRTERNVNIGVVLILAFLYLMLFLIVRHACRMIRIQETEKREAQEALQRHAIHDSLTEVYNRGYFQYRIEEEIARADRSQHALAIMICDLDLSPVMRKCTKSGHEKCTSF